MNPFNDKKRPDASMVIRPRTNLDKASKIFMWAYLFTALLGIGFAGVIIWAIIRLVLKYT